MRILILSKDKILFILSLLGLGLTLAFLAFSLLRITPAESKLKQTTILIDPGHGGIDGGTQDAHGHLEKDINLAIALKIRDYLRQSGVNVAMTREDDRELAAYEPGRSGRHRRDLSSRIERAKKVKALFLVSIHCDWSADPKRRGMVAFYYYRNPAGKNLAFAIQEELNKIQPTPKKAAPGRYFILEQPGVTGVIIEVGFLSHPEEAALLQRPDYQNKIAFGIARGILQVLPALISGQDPTAPAS
ncbi:MAG: hypothetical protein GX081_03695 [Firmicutes bacterium]|nr:hypothetical protein [Bacillota bacterium]